MKHLLIVFFMSLFVLAFVWQNVEVMKTKLECRKLSAAARELRSENDRVLYIIEQYRRMDYVEARAADRGMRRITPRDFDVMTVPHDTK